MINERDWEEDRFKWDYSTRQCGLCNGLFKGTRERVVCRECVHVVIPVPPRVKDALDLVVRNIDLGDE